MFVIMFDKNPCKFTILKPQVKAFLIKIIIYNYSK